jgi:hypothetical protein
VKDWTELNEKVSVTDYFALKRQFIKTGDNLNSQVDYVSTFEQRVCHLVRRHDFFSRELS